MQIEFASRKLERRYTESGEAIKGWGSSIGRKYIMRIDAIIAARDVSDLRASRALGFHKLVGDRRGQYAMKLTANWRLCVRLPDGEEGSTVRVESVVDYHG